MKKLLLVSLITIVGANLNAGEKGKALNTIDVLALGVGGLGVYFESIGGGFKGRLGPIGDSFKTVGRGCMFVAVATIANSLSNTRELSQRSKAQEGQKGI